MANHWMDVYTASHVRIVPMSELETILRKYSTEQVIEAIGIEKVQSYLRKKKLETLKKYKL
jgi:hypothetical protein